MTAVRAAVAAFREGCSAVSPFFCVKQSLCVMRNSLKITAEGASKSIPLEISSRVTVIAFGKASVAMTAAAEEVLGDRFKAGAVLAPHGIPQDFPLKSRIFHGAKDNLPDDDSVSGTMELLKEIARGDLPQNIILFLISGGGSALFCAPEGVTLEEKLETIRILVNHGATIQQLNAVRQSLSSVKGGRTLERVKHAQVISLIISDVIGDPVSLIASGPTVSPSSLSSPLSILSSLSCSPSFFPSTVISRLSSFSPSISPPSNPSFHAIIASNPIALSSVSSSLSSSGFHPIILSSSLSGDASQRGIQFSHLISSPRSSLNDHLKDLVPQQKITTDFSRLALIFGGETTVEGAGKGGLGGRSQHMVLSCLKELLDKPRPLNSFVFLSAGTDGQDGPTKAAGAVISEEDVYQADPVMVSKYLEEMNSFHFWSNFREGACHVITGKTGTNVMDVQILLIDYGK